MDRRSERGLGVYRDGMNSSRLVSVYGSEAESYRNAFRVFLEHTDQKETARLWLKKLARSMSARSVFIDAGAGNGRMTSWLAGGFERTIAIEPNRSLREELRQICPGVDVLSEEIMEASPSDPGDLVLCCHVLYYVDRANWRSTVDRLVSWLSPKGVLVIVLQNDRTDCMEMLDRFLGEHYDLSTFGRTFEEERGDEFDVSIETVQAHVTTQDIETAYQVAEFMLNCLPIREAPRRRDVEQYVGERFRNPDGGFRFSCHQDFLAIRQRL